MKHSFSYNWNIWLQVVVVGIIVVIHAAQKGIPINDNDDDADNVKRRHEQNDSILMDDTTHELLKRPQSQQQRILSIDDFGAIPDHETEIISLQQHHRRIRMRNLHPFYAPITKTTVQFDEEENDDDDNNNEDEETSLYSDNNELLHPLDELLLLQEVAITNTLAFNEAIQQARPGDVVLVPDGHSYTMMGGVQGRYLDHVTIDVAGTLHFAYNRHMWPFHNNTQAHDVGYQPAIQFQDCTNLTITSSSQHRAVAYVDYDNNMVYLDHNAGMGGLINGDGKDWWNDAIAGRLPDHNGDTRPRLLYVKSCADVLVQHLTLVNSPFWTLTVEAVGAEVAHVNILVDRRYQTQLFAESELLLALPTEPSTSSSSSSSSNDQSALSQEFLDPLDYDDDAPIPVDVTSSRTRQLRHHPHHHQQHSSKDSFDFVFPVDDLPDWVFRRLRQPQDLNTDGIDPIGMHIYIHDCIVQNADDSVAVKPSPFGQYAAVVNGTIPYTCTRNITIENMVLTGFGASIGSVGPTKYHPCVDQVVFRNITMPGTGKGIYIKSDGSDCHYNVSSRITNILYEDVYIRNPFWWAIWIGPQQQHQPNTRIGRKCPLTYPLPGNKHCPTQGCVLFENITLRNIYIEDPIISPGVIMGNATNPMRNLVFDNVTTTVPHWKPYHGRWPFHGKRYPWRPGFQCQHAQGTCTQCQPPPTCFHP